MSFTTITEFHPLRQPHKDGDRTDQWCTYAVDNGMLYLLNGGSFQLADLLDIDIHKDIHFDSEAECHSAAYTYYRQHCMPYPHAYEWRKALCGYRQPASSEIESEHMTFK